MNFVKKKHEEMKFGIIFTHGHHFTVMSPGESLGTSSRHQDTIRPDPDQPRPRGITEEETSPEEHMMHLAGITTPWARPGLCRTLIIVIKICQNKDGHECFVKACCLTMPGDQHRTDDMWCPHDADQWPCFRAGGLRRLQQQQRDGRPGEEEELRRHEDGQCHKQQLSQQSGEL